MKSIHFLAPLNLLILFWNIQPQTGKMMQHKAAVV